MPQRRGSSGRAENPSSAAPPPTKSASYSSDLLVHVLEHALPPQALPTAPKSSEQPGNAAREPTVPEFPGAVIAADDVRSPFRCAVSSDARPFTVVMNLMHFPAC